jgi:glutamate-1-semialdehyde aminotransferase
LLFKAQELVLKMLFKAQETAFEIHFQDSKITNLRDALSASVSIVQNYLSTLG